MTTRDAARAVLAAETPPTGSAALAALWWASRPDGWEAAHARVQDATGPDAAWVHAHLHRAEGDPGNAAYWYARAGRPAFDGPLADERAAIAAALLAGGRGHG